MSFPQFHTHSLMAPANQIQNWMASYNSRFLPYGTDRKKSPVPGSWNTHTQLPFPAASCLLLKGYTVSGNSLLYLRPCHSDILRYVSGNVPQNIRIFSLLNFIHIHLPLQPHHLTHNPVCHLHCPYKHEHVENQLPDIAPYHCDCRRIRIDCGR